MVVRAGLLLAIAVVCRGVAWAQTSDPKTVSPAVLPQVSQPPATPHDADLDHYLIAPDDLLNIYVLNVPELSRNYRVSPSGRIHLPLLTKPIQAEGKTPSQLSRIVGAELRASGMVEHPYVTINVKPSPMHAVAITGAVEKPQIYPIYGEITLLDALAQAGGLARNAGDTATITRGHVALSGLDPSCGNAGGDKTACLKTLRVNLYGLLEEGNPKLNVALYPGDQVTVQRARIVYVVGAVNRAGGYPIEGAEKGMTVLRALALARSVTPAAKSQKALILRRDPTAPGGRQEIPVNLKKILKGKLPDVRLEANDVLFVPESASKKALGPAVQAALTTLSGLVIWRF